MHDMTWTTKTFKWHWDVYDHFNYNLKYANTTTSTNCLGICIKHIRLEYCSRDRYIVSFCNTQKDYSIFQFSGADQG